MTTSKVPGAYYKLIAHSFIRFLIVGTIGFIVNFLVLSLTFKVLDLPIWFAQLLSAEISLITTFFGNNYWSYKGHDHIHMGRKFITFQLTATTGLLINTFIVSVLVTHAHMFYGLALAFGSIASLLWNHNANKHFVFKKQKRS